MSIRLIDTTTLRMRVFDGNAIPEYAILSHTWVAENEVSLQEMTRIISDPDHPAMQKSGYRKIVTTCKLSKNQKIKYVWIDTCCIDKTSSAELSEAINSMFRWYQNAEVCYVFLSDLPRGSYSTSALRKCKWFTRGWCLQELIAPRNIQFYDKTWAFVGTKAQLKHSLVDITNIDEAVLNDCSILHNLPVARKMSWASRRTTTRIEDIAYCLLGIFDVNMPMLYGEGERAFLRLQEEIIKRSNDLSIFCCTLTTESSDSGPNRAPSSVPKSNSARKTGLDNYDNSESETGYSGVKTQKFDYRLPYRNLFARSPKGFVHCGEVRHAGTDVLRTQEFSLTNKGVYFKNAELLLVQADEWEDWACYTMSLNCFKHELAAKEFELVLRKVGPALFVRLPHSWLRSRKYQRYPGASDEEPYTENEEAYIITTVVPSIYKQLDSARHYSIQIRSFGNDVREALQEADPRDRWDATIQGFLTRGEESFEGYIKVYPSLIEGVLEESDAEIDSDYFCLACGHDSGDPHVAWVRMYSSHDWKRHQMRTGKMAGLKYLLKANPLEDFTRHKLRLDSILIRARIEISDVKVSGYPFFTLNLEFESSSRPKKNR